MHFDLQCSVQAAKVKGYALIAAIIAANQTVGDEERMAFGAKVRVLVEFTEQ